MTSVASTNAEQTAEPVLSVSQLTLFIKELVEAAFPSVWVSGEISNFSRPQSGHCYLTLKDEQAQIKAVIWRGTAARMRFDPHDGLEVICRGRLDLYSPRGTYQLVIEEIQPKGIGALELALRKLRERLSAEGLFEPAHKQRLPMFPRQIAFVTSPTGAAVRDFLEVLRRRWRGANVLIVPVRVQGEGAALEIAAAIDAVNRMSMAATVSAISDGHHDRKVDVLVVGRGGGSMEDLWAFNEEPVIRAIYRSIIPVVSAVGHEIDVTLSDLAADVRALTPSEAAERVVPAADEIRSALHVRQQRLINALRRRAENARRSVELLTNRRVFRKPFDRMLERSRELDLLTTRANRAAWQLLGKSQRKLQAMTAHLESLSPLAVLSRGYSLTTRAADGRLIDDESLVSDGELIRTRLARGELMSRVDRTL